MSEHQNITEATADLVEVKAEHSHLTPAEPPVSKKFSDKTYPGLIIPSHKMISPQDKDKASKTLIGWKPVELTGKQWIEKLTRGQTVQTSASTPRGDGTFTHSIENWIETYFVYADADHIKGVEFDDNGNDKNPNGVDPFTDPHHLYSLYPTLQNKVYAVTQSISSMSNAKKPPHRRYRLIFVFDAPITSLQHYHTVLLALAKQFPIIPPLKRSPTQPVYGNARNGYAEPSIFENVLSLTDYPAPIETPRKQRDRIRGAIDTKWTGTADPAALDFIHPSSLNYNEWLSVITACKQAGLTSQQADAWSRQGSKYKEGEVETRWDGLSLDVSWGAVVNLAKLNGYKPKRNHKPVKLRKRTDLECTTEPIEKAREALRQAFDRGENLIGFRADTGIGKTHEAIKLYQIKGIGGFISTPTTDLAKEEESRLIAAGVNVFRWRGIHAEQDGRFPHEKPCMFPDIFKAYVLSGRNAYQMLCQYCPYLDECEQDGYRSQEAEAKAAQVVVGAHKDLLFNPLFRSTAERLLPQHKEDMITIDEFDVFEAFIEVKIAQTRLEYLRDTWQDHPLGDFAKDLLNAIVVQNAPHTGISNILKMLSGIDHETIIEALASYRIGDKVYNRKEAHEIASDIGRSTEHIETLPKIETEDWNLLIQLEIFIDTFRHAAGAPIEWKDNTLTFYLPPLPLYTEAKVLCMSATLNQTFFEKAFEARQEKRNDVGFIDADDTEWHPEAKVYQLRTNRNPRSTLSTAEKIKGTDGKERWHYTGFSTTGQQTYDAILESAKANPHRRHALISFKWVIDTHADALQEANIITGHFGGLVGLDQHFGRDTDTPIDLHILGAPEVPPYETERRYKLLYGDRETPPDFTRNDTTGAYQDPIVQSIYEAGVKSELMQAIGRAGLVKNPSTVILWTSHDLPSVSHREQTQHFDEVDWAAADNNLDALPGVIAQRKAQEATEAEAIASGDVQAVAEIKDVSDRHARRLTQQRRTEQKAEQKADSDAQVIALHQQGKSLRKIHAEIGKSLGISYGTIAKVVKAYRNGHALYSNLIGDVRSCTPPTNTDVPCVESEPLHISEPDAQTGDTSPPIPPTDYSSLDLYTARQEMERCQKRNNYNGAAFLRNHIQKQERKLRTLKKGNTMDFYGLLTTPESELFEKIDEINTIANNDTSPERDTAIDTLNNLSTLLSKRFGSSDHIMIAPGHLLTFGTMPDKDTGTPL